MVLVVVFPQKKHPPATLFSHSHIYCFEETGRSVEKLQKHAGGVFLYSITSYSSLHHGCPSHLKVFLGSAVASNSHVGPAILIHVIIVIIVVFLALLHLLVQFSQDLLSLNVFVEVKDVSTEIYHHFDLANEDLVKLLDVVFDIGARLVDIL